MALILGKKTFGRLETLQYANKKFEWGESVIGISCFFGFWAWVWARLTGRKVIYYCIDFYSPEIIKNSWDRVFTYSAMQMDKFLTRHVDEVWDISERINLGRYAFGDYAFCSKIVPLSYPPSYFRFETNVIKDLCVFVGIVPYGVELLGHYVWLKNSPVDVLLNNLSFMGIGVSLWKENGNNFYGDPGKTKLYSACGLPVIMTGNTPYAKVIKETGAGIVVPYDKQAVKDAIDKIIVDYDYYKNNVKKTWKFISADDVFRRNDLLV